MKTTVTYVSVSVYSETHDKLKKLAFLTKKPICKIIAELVNDVKWLESSNQKEKEDE